MVVVEEDAIEPPPNGESEHDTCGKRPWTWTETYETKGEKKGKRRGGRGYVDLGIRVEHQVDTQKG